MAFGVAAGIALAATQTAARQAEPPVWAQLAECSAVFSAAAGAEGYAGTAPDDLADAEAAAARFLERAVEVAGAMGQVDPAADVESIMVYLRPRWQNRADRLLSVRSNLDWIAHCGRLGRAEGVLPLP